MSEIREPIRFQGTIASAGMAAGRIVLLNPVAPRSQPAAAPGEPRPARLRQALQEAIAELTRILADADGEDAAEILEFQIAMLEDEALIRTAIDAIERGTDPAAAWQTTLDDEIRGYRGAEDDYFQARAIDLQDLRDRVLRRLQGEQQHALPEGAIVVGDDLSPSLFLEHRRHISGIVLHRGSSSSHVAILARAQETPMLVGVGSTQLPAGTEVLLDATRGHLTINPGTLEWQHFSQARQRAEQLRHHQRSYLQGPARLPGGERVDVLVNLSGIEELDALQVEHCDGIGLVRTEFLFAHRNALPDEEEQYRVYRRMVEWAAGRPVTVRTLDAGGDKPVAGITLEGESNPFLGVRGLRLSLRHPQLFRIQVRAMLRAARHGPLRLMLPMVTEPKELQAARQLIEQARVEAGTDAVPVGIMVEVPACAMDITRFDADFFSIGSNDLLQYLTACGRDSSELQHLLRPDNPPLLAAIEKVVADAARIGKPVSLCGDMAADPRCLGLLLDHGLRAVSVAPAALARTKATVVNHRSGQHG